MQLERFKASIRTRRWLALRAAVTAQILWLALAAAPAPAQTLDRVKEAGRVKLGYLVDMRPFSFKNDSGAPDGYSVALCQRIVADIKTQVGRTDLAVEWVPVTVEARASDIKEGRIDLLCSPMTVSLERRADVSFSIPVFGGGNRAVMRADSVAALRRALDENPTVRPVWRGEPAAKVLQGTTFAVVSGTTTASWLESTRASFQVDAKIVPVADYHTGLQQLVDRKVDVLFGERTLVVGAMNSSERESLVVLDRLFTQEPGALALARGDEDLRLLVDRTLSRLYATTAFSDLYRQWFGEFNGITRAFFLWNTLEQ